MYNKNKNSSISQMTEEERREESKKIQIEIDRLQQKELDENGMKRLMELIRRLKEVDEPPKFDVEDGWKDFEKNHLPKVEKHMRDKEMEQLRKHMYRKLYMRKLTDFVILVGFTVVFTLVAIGRSGFVNYNYYDSIEMDVISSKSIEKIQQDVEDEYISLEKESGTKIARLDLDTDKYLLQYSGSSKRYMSVEYLNKKTKEYMVFCVFKYKPNNGEFNIEKDKIIETYVYQDVAYNIIENKERYFVSWDKNGVYYSLQNCESAEECKNLIETISY